MHLNLSRTLALYISWMRQLTTAELRDASLRGNKSRPSSYPLYVLRCSNLARHSNNNLSPTTTHPVKPPLTAGSICIRRVSENCVDRVTRRNKEPCVALSRKSSPEAFNGDLKRSAKKTFSFSFACSAFNVNYASPCSRAPHDE